MFLFHFISKCKFNLNPILILALSWPWFSMLTFLFIEYEIQRLLQIKWMTLCQYCESWSTFNSWKEGNICQMSWYLFLFIYLLFASDTHNLDHMYPYQLLSCRKKRKTVLVGKREIIVAIITEFLIKSLSIHVIRGFHVQSTQIAVYLLQQH